MMQIARAEIKELIKSSNGLFITVTFIKKNGEIRVLNGRTSVAKFAKGGIDTTAHIDKYIKIWDAKNEGYRNVNSETITEIKMNGIIYQVVD